MDKISVSVIVSVFNAEKYLKKCISSIINQTYKNIEIIIINDGSTDKSLKIINKFKCNYNNIIVINQTNSGVAVARNKGLDIASGKYVCFIDADDYINKYYIEKLYTAIEKTKSDIVECNYFKVEEDGTIIEKKNLGSYDSTDNYQINKDFLYGLSFTNTVWNKIFSKDLIKKIRFKKYVTSEDHEFLANCYINCKRKININDFLYYYVNNLSSVCNKKFSHNIFDVIYARIDVYKLYKKYNYDYLCELVASRILFFIFDYYRKCDNLDIKMKKGYKKELKEIYKKYYKIASELKIRVDGRKLSTKQQILLKIQLYSFLICPKITYFMIDYISKKNKK